MRYLSLFSGIEAATVAWHPLGWECVGVAEIEPFPCAVLKHHYPDVPNLGSVTDITEADIKALGHIDLVVFGSPCQDLSVAGHRKGLINADGTVTRSGLFFTAINIARWSGARFWLWENVPGAYSSNKGRDFAAVVEFMAGLDECPIPERGWATEGVAVGDNGLLEWACLDAQWFGVAQRRRRVFALLDTGDWANRPPILLEPESLRGDSAPRREAREDVAGTIAARFGISRNNHEECVAQTLQARRGGFDLETETPIIARPLLSGGNSNNPLDENLVLSNDPAAAICANEQKTYTNEGSVFQLRNVVGTVAYGIPGNWIGRKPENGGNAVEPMVEVSPCQTSADRHGVVAPFRETADCLTSIYGTKWNGNASATNGSLFAGSSMQVRRLTPVECERLQGFPDNYTNIPWRKQTTSPDGPRYKALGNSMAVPVMRWIGRKIQESTCAS